MHTTKTILAILMGSLILSGRLLAQRGVLRAVDRADYQYFIAPTGFVPKPGDRLFRSSNIALNQLQLVQNGGGILGIGFLFRKPLWAIGQTHFPKFRNRGPVYNVAAVFVETPEDDERGSDLGAVFSSVTLGNRQKHFSIGAGALVLGADPAPGARFPAIPLALTLHAKAPLTSHTFLMTENYILWQEGSWGIAGLSGFRFSTKRVVLDLGTMLMILPADWQFESRTRFWGGAPIVNLHVNFYRKAVAPEAE
ncbi:MAG: hypothetical protein J0L99_12645 [Chitinophagales bacterium]|nr:hypothetical protein [Chitinophagales bacterium]